MTNFIHENGFSEYFNESGDKVIVTEMEVGNDAHPLDDEYTNRDKEDFYFLIYEILLIVSEAADELKIPESKAQRCLKKNQENLQDIAQRKESEKRHLGRPLIFNEEHKNFIIDSIDEYPSLIINQMMDGLTEKIEGLKIEKSALISKTRAKTTTILEAVSTDGVININVRLSKALNQSKKTKTDYGRSIRIGTVTDRYLNFINLTMDIMDKHNKFKGHYIVIDNASIHMYNDIQNITESLILKVFSNLQYLNMEIVGAY
ncbi:hypothetical protein BJ944DRAFT_238084 [Cunninghamella echinulata]|nr:hypothetical protein BJ944DRAFT_238084 [Cunninghamella echinulata]